MLDTDGTLDFNCTFPKPADVPANFTFRSLTPAAGEPRRARARARLGGPAQAPCGRWCRAAASLARWRALWSSPLAAGTVSPQPGSAFKMPPSCLPVMVGTRPAANLSPIHLLTLSHPESLPQINPAPNPPPPNPPPPPARLLRRGHRALRGGARAPRRHLLLHRAPAVPRRADRARGVRREPEWGGSGAKEGGSRGRAGLPQPLVPLPA